MVLQTGRSRWTWAPRFVWRILQQVGVWRIAKGAGRAVRTASFVVLAIIIGFFIPPLFIEGIYFSVGGRLADWIFVHEAPPSDSEGQPVPGARPYSADDVVTLGGRGEGLNCSLPFGVERAFFDRSRRFSPDAENKARRYAPISLQMRQACAHHDYCYRHGAATYGYSQGDCDYILQEHAYRLCRYFSTPLDMDKCRTKARMITLGVRVGGAGSFKGRAPTNGEVETAWPESRFSTYYEFDPYPLRSTAYSVVRLADAPADWTQAHRKAMYVFTFHRSGMRVRILGWAKDAAVTVDRGTPPTRRFDRTFSVNGRFDGLATPPLVLSATDGNGTSRDQLVFWQRHSMQDTGGRFVVIVPGIATVEDWRRLSDPSPDSSTAPCDASTPAVLKPAAIVAFRQRKDCSSRPRDDFDVADFHPISSPKGARGLRLMALRRTPCVLGQRAACLMELELAPDQLAANHYAPPFRMIAPSHDLPDGDPRYHADRYRAFVAPPFSAALEGHAKALVMWTRRGDESGVDYRDHADLRRHMAHENSSFPARYFPEVRLVGLQEEHEPIALLNRDDDQKTLVSLSADRRTFFQDALNFARLLMGGLADHIHPNAPIENAPRVLRAWKLPEAKEAGARETLYVKQDRCDVRVPAEWLTRAPLVDAQSKPARIMLSRMDATSHSTRLAFATLTIRTGNLGCDFQVGATVATGGATIEALRRWPLLLARLDGPDAPATLLLANLDAPERSLLYAVPAPPPP